MELLSRFLRENSKPAEFRILTFEKHFPKIKWETQKTKKSVESSNTVKPLNQPPALSNAANNNNNNKISFMSSDMSRCCSGPASARHTNHKTHSATWDEKASAIARNPRIGDSGQICRRRRSEKRGAAAHRRRRARLRRCETAGMHFCVHVFFFVFWVFFRKL